MIVVFPILTDESISHNVLPGICKALEKFILVYEMDAVMKMTGLKVLKIGGKIAGSMVAASGMLAKTKTESDNLLEVEPPPEHLRPRTKDEQKQQDYHTDKSKTTKPGEQIFDTMKGIKDLGTVKVDMPKDQSLSLEPTYIMVTTTTGTKIIGIKVIPFPVKTKDGHSLADLLTVDASLKFMDTMVFQISRKVIRAFWALCRGLRVPFLKDRVITGDPEKDILWASSFHKRFVFCLLNFADISDSNFFRNAGGIHKLHSIGWNSFVLADDVNKRAIFCMKEFHGLCSSVPYQFIYSSFGKDNAKVYDNLEDVKKSASPFFKVSVSAKKVFGESINTLKDYLKRIS